MNDFVASTGICFLDVQEMLKDKNYPKLGDRIHG